MHIVRWLFSHPIVLTWVLTILALLFYWGATSGDDHHAEKAAHGEAVSEVTNTEVAVIDQAQNAVATGGEVVADAANAVTDTVSEATEATAGVVKGMAGEAATVTNQMADEAQNALASVAAQIPGTPDAPVMPETPAEPQAPVMPTTPVAPAKQTQAAASQVDTQQQQVVAPVQSAPAQAEASAAVAVAAVTPNAAAIAEQAPAQQAVAPAETALATTTPADLLRAAREAYWSNELDRSVEFYTQLLQQDPNPAYKGELANVYWKQGKAQDAANAFMDVVPTLIKQGRMQEVMNIKLYVGAVDPAKAAQIDAMMK